MTQELDIPALLAAALRADRSAAAIQGPADEQDVRHLYRAVLGREAEAEALRKAPGRKLHELTTDMLAGGEFASYVLRPLVEDRPTAHRRLPDAVWAELVPWLERRMGCSALDPRPGAPGVADGLLRLFLHPALTPVLYQAHGSLFEQALTELHRLWRSGGVQLLGKIEFVNREFVSGWLFDASGRIPRPQVEVRCRGRVVATSAAFSYRPDIERAHGGHGLCGFRAPWNAGSLPQGELAFTLHEASTGLPVGPIYRFANGFVDQLGVAQMLAKEFEEIQRRLDVLAGLVPQALGYTAYPLEHYDLYRQAHGVPVAPALPPQTPATRFTVLLDAHQADATAVRISLDSLRAQAGALPWTVFVVGANAEVTDTVRMLAVQDERLQALASWAEAPALLQRLGADPADWVLLLTAGELLDAQALPWLHAARQSTGALALYWDEDRIVHRSGRLPAREARHADPVLRCNFDPDSLLELNTVGTSFAVRADVLEAATGLLAAHPPAQAGEAPPAPLQAEERERLVWAVARHGAWGHVPQFLLSRTDLALRKGQPAGMERLVARATPADLAPVLPEAWAGRRWHREPDGQATAQPKQLVHWWPQQPNAPLSVLVPTRDHADLVRVCVDSLRTMAAYPEALDIVIADNGSTEPDTLAYLAEGAQAGLFRVLRIDEPFNWSRLNNQMAAQAKGQHLLFLNNDTRMLSRHWDRTLRGLLERPEVGAVGARLLYEDMTLQHAGIQFGFEGFVGHRAMGEPVDAPTAIDSTALTGAVPGVTGAFIACRAEVFRQVGGFDAEALGVTFNDVDWCIRVREAGLRILYAPALTLIHYESKSRGFDFMSPEKQRRAEYEADRLLSRHGRLADDGRWSNPRWAPWAPRHRALR